MVQWASRECPNLSLDDLRKETRAMRNHRYRTGRIEWVGCWENWMLEEDKRRADRMRPAAGAANFTRREATVAQHLPGIAAPIAPPPGPPPRTTSLTVLEDVSDAQPRRIANES